MELDTIRKELDKVDQSLRFLMLLRASIAIRAGTIKTEHNMPIFQAERERKIYATLEQFSEQTGVSSEMLTHIYKELIGEATRIEENLGQYNFELNNQLVVDLKQSLSAIGKTVDTFLFQMNALVTSISSSNTKGDELLGHLAQAFKELLV